MKPTTAIYAVLLVAGLAAMIVGAMRLTGRLPASFAAADWEGGLALVILAGLVGLAWFSRRPTPQSGKKT